MPTPHIIEGVFDYNLRFRTHAGKGTFGDIPFSFSVNIDGSAVFVEFEKLPHIMFKLEDLVRHSYDVLENEEYVKDGQYTEKEYDGSLRRSTKEETK